MNADRHPRLMWLIPSRDGYASSLFTVRPVVGTFYYPQVRVSLLPLLFERRNICFKEFLDQGSYPRIVGDHCSHSGQSTSRDVHDARLLLAVLVGQAECPPRRVLLTDAARPVTGGADAGD